MPQSNRGSAGVLILDVQQFQDEEPGPQQWRVAGESCPTTEAHSYGGSGDGDGGATADDDDDDDGDDDDVVMIVVI